MSRFALMKLQQGFILQQELHTVALSLGSYDVDYISFFLSNFFFSLVLYIIILCIIYLSIAIF